jgi:Fe-S-cluster-containing dehydrogenase component
MLIDIGKCIGCDACSVACKVENSTPGNIWWAPVLQKEIGKYPNAKMLFLPTLCMHCEDPPCMKSCPSKAISKRSDGIVIINEDKCCGTAACVSACPYNAITIWQKESGQELVKPTNPFEDLTFAKHKIGAAQKCTFCVHRMDKAEKGGLKIGIDREATPACVITCPADCRIFGDISDPSSPPSKYLEEAKKGGRTIFALIPEAKTKPKVAYVG